MSEESLKILSMDDVCAIMIRAIEEYMLLQKFHQTRVQLDEKRDEIKILHKVIAVKQAQRSH